MTFPGEHLLRELVPQVLAALTRRHGDFSSAEDAVQEALVIASSKWAADGVPDHPKAWLIQVARRRLTDQLRAELARRRRETTMVTESPPLEVAAPDSDIVVEREDDTLLLLFMCCHSSLTPASAIALTLRAVGGLTTLQIANAFLVPEPTMAQRISRAKQSIKKSGLPFAMPTDDERDERLSSVLHVLYLVFNEGYASSDGPELQRVDLATEAIRLARDVRRLAPAHAEAGGLLALMLLTDARRAARTGPAGELVPLDEQDRRLWDKAAIEEGTAIVSAALARGKIGPYQLQAAVAAVHGEAGRMEDTDWRQILALYAVLAEMADNPMVTLNRAIAAAMVHGPNAGLELLKALDADERMTGHHRLDAVRAHLLQMAGDHERALVHYRAAAEKTSNVSEQRYLTEKAARMERMRN